MKNLNSVAEFAENYDAFILDIWGVIHDGVEAYDGVLECLQQLKKANKKIIFLSNAPRRSYKVKNTLKVFGVTEDLYSDAISSGEVAYEIITSRYASANSCNYFYIGPEKDSDLLSGANFIQSEASKAKFAIVTGFDDDNSGLEEKLPQIEEALKHKLKLYCVNPDKIVVRQNGSSMLCAGVIGEYYAKQKGEVEFIGKPYTAVYEKCFALINKVPKNKIAAIGDNLDTDILGANNAGIDSVLCLGGVLKAEKKPYNQIIKECGIHPKITIPKFSW